MTRTTSKDVARVAGVSQATVSFVLNGRHLDRISEQTRRTVLEAAETLGYVPSASGRALRSGNSKVVALVVPEMRVSEAIEVFKRELSAALTNTGYVCVMIHTLNGVELPPSFWNHIDPAAVIGLDKLSPHDAETVRKSRVPLLDGLVLQGGAVDQRTIGASQIRHLAAQGHTRIGYAAAEGLETPISEFRIEGARAAVAELGLPELRVEAVGYEPGSAGAALSVLLTPELPVTAVAAFNDVIALSLLSAATTRGLSVPQQFAVIGVDDITLARLASPPLSTIAIDLSAAAAAIAAEVVALIDGLPAPTAYDRTSALNIIRRETT